MSTLADRVRRRIREEMSRRHLSQQHVADLLQWTQSRVAQKLRERNPTPITLDELEGLTFATELLASEVVRDHGLEFCAEMTPTELRMFQAYRALPPHDRETIERLLATLSGRQVKSGTNPDRHAGPLPSRKLKAR